MNIRKHWKKIVLSCAAAFWASCSENESCTKPNSFENSSNSSDHPNDIQSSSSNEFSQESSSGVFTGTSSNDVTNVAPMYGIYQPSSNSSNGKIFRRASDTTVTCTSDTSYFNVFLEKNERSTQNSCQKLMNSLENDVLAADEIDRMESDLAFCEGSSFAAEYGVIGINSTMTVSQIKYDCSNGETLYGHYDGNSYVKDGLLYTKEEYQKAFPESSSSVESSSSEKSSGSIENQGCNKTDFVTKNEAANTLAKEYAASLISEGSSEEYANCIKKEIQDKNSNNYLYDVRGYIAKTQKCPDGTTSENNRYSQIREEVKILGEESANKCKAKTGTLDLMKTPVNVNEGEKIAFNGDTCEVVSTYNSWFGHATGYGKGLSNGAEEISNKVDELVKDDNLSYEKTRCLEDVKTMLDNGIALYGPMPENYPQEIKCSDGIVKETDHYKERLKEYNEGVEEGFNESIKLGNGLIDECEKK